MTKAGSTEKISILKKMGQVRHFKSLLELILRMAILQAITKKTTQQTLKLKLKKR